MTALPAFEELARHGYGAGTGLDLRSRGDLQSLVSLATSALSLAWLVAVASSAACGLTSEREEDTWISLIGTPMDGPEILRAKRLGAFLRPRALILTLLGLWTLGVAAGAIHPLSLAALAAELAAVGGFAAALGTYLSLRSRTTGRALASTLGGLFALLAGLTVAGLMVDGRDASNFLFLLCPPYLLSSSCGDHAAVRHAIGLGEEGGPSWDSAFVRTAAFQLAATALYALGGLLLSRRADSRFDRAVDRPRRPARAAPS